ncbi:hypothetical protein, partial [Caballeronia catudaia]|uniref:hypothetical protein n=1 Tax=Caballeronia catudaia TaxID=1777136 RepID=UPI000ABFDFE4
IGIWCSPLARRSAKLGSLRQSRGGSNHLWIWRWHNGFVSALREYLHDDAARAILERRKSFESDIELALQGLQALARISTDRDLQEAVRLVRRHYAIGVFRPQYCAATIDTLKRVKMLRRENVYPLARDDDTARERLFVARLADLHWQIFRKSKPDVIACLMALEGFSTMLEERTVERLCAKFQQQGRQLYGLAKQISDGIDLDADLQPSVGSEDSILRPTTAVQT